MRAKRMNQKEQLRLVMECRASGMTDAQWCLEHDIKPGTFYNWVKNLRKHPEISIPEHKEYAQAYPQEIVQVVIPQETDVVKSPSSEVFHLSSPLLTSKPIAQDSVMELLVGNVSLKIPTGTDPDLLRITIQLLKEQLC